MSGHRSIAASAAIVVGFFIPQLLGGSALVFSTAVVIAIFAVMAYGVDIVLSDLGEVSLAHTVFFAVGAYVVGVFGARYGMNAWTTLVLSIVMSASVAAILGLITLRVQGFVFSLVTYATTIVCFNIAHNWQFVGASDGIVGLPALDLSFAGVTLRATDNKTFWPFAYVLLIGVILTVERFRQSSIGRSAYMVHQNERLAIMSGISPRAVRLRVLVISAVVTSLGGWLYSYQRSYVGPDLFETYFLILMLTAVVLPGKRVLLGPLIGTAILMVQKSFLSFGGYFDKIVLGLALMAVLALYPEGLAGLWRNLVEKVATRLRSKRSVQRLAVKQSEST